jgi:restriction system protein
MNYYLVRTPEELVRKSVVGIGWRDTNFATFSSVDSLLQSMGGLGRRANAVRRFFTMKNGDIVVVPLHRSIVVGVVDGGLEFHQEHYAIDRPNQRTVKFITALGKQSLAQISRDELSEKFQRRLRVPGGIVLDISEFNGEIDSIVKALSDGKSHSWDDGVQATLLEKEDSFRQGLFRNIQDGHTNLKAGGIGLEYLVTELLIVDGYAASVLSKRAFASFADADIKASKEDRISSTNVLIQVKHHRGTTGDWGIKQLEEIKKQSGIDYSDYELVLVTSEVVPGNWTGRIVKSKPEIRSRKCPRNDVSTAPNSKLKLL